MGQRKRSRAEWETLITSQQLSGQSQKAWCIANGVNYHTFSDRARRQQRQVLQEPPRIEWAEARGAPEVAVSAGIQIAIGSYCVAVSDGFNEETLLRVCQALERLC